MTIAEFVLSQLGHPVVRHCNDDDLDIGNVTSSPAHHPQTLPPPSNSLMFVQQPNGWALFREGISTMGLYPTEAADLARRIIGFTGDYDLEVYPLDDAEEEDDEKTQEAGKEEEEEEEEEGMDTDDEDDREKEGFSRSITDTFAFHHCVLLEPSFALLYD